MAEQKNDHIFGEIVSIDDPDKMGRSQVRIFGKHDNKTQIPDKDLPWISLIKPGEPAINKIGTGGNPFLKGTVVSLRSWDYGNSQQNWFITGAIPRSGLPQGGVTANGSQKIDTAKSDTPTASRAKDVNTVVTNPIKNTNTTPGSESDDGGKNIYNDIMKVGAKFADHATIASLQKLTKGNLLDIIKKIDPNNIGGSVKNALDKLLQLKKLDLLTSISGIQNLVKIVMKDSVNQAAQNSGMQNKDFLALIQKALELELSLEPPDPMIVELLTELLEGQDTGPISNDSDIDDFAKELINWLNSLQQNHQLENPYIFHQTLKYLLSMLMTQAQSQGDSKGFGGTDLNNIEQALKSCGIDIKNTINKLTSSVLDESKIKETLKDFARSHQILDKKENIVKAIFNGK